MVKKKENNIGTIPEKATKGNGRGGARPGSGRPKGDSEMFHFRAPGAMAKVINEQESKTDYIKESIARRIAQDELALSKVGDVVPASKVRDIILPFFDVSVAAGFPIPLDNDEKAQNIELLRMLCPNPDSCYLIRVKGNSMIEANLHDGDVVIVDKSNRNPGPHDAAMCEFNGEYTIKRFEKRGGEGLLIPYNPDFKEIRVTPDDEFMVWGVVTYIIHKPNL